MATRQIFRLSNFETSSRCWIPIQRNFSSRQRIVNSNLHSLSEVNLISNDEVLHHEVNAHTTNRIVNVKNGQDEVPFDPIVSSVDEVYTASPVNKA